MIKTKKAALKTAFLRSGAAGIRTLVRKCIGQAFYTFSLALVVEKNQAAKLAKFICSSLSAFNEQERFTKRLFLMMPLM